MRLIQPLDNQVRVIWSGGTLQEAGQVEGPYIDVDPQPTSPWTFTPTEKRKFFRVRNGQRVDIDYRWKHDDVPLPINRDMVISLTHISRNALNVE